MAYERERRVPHPIREESPATASPGQGLGEENSLLQELLRGLGAGQDEGRDGAGRPPSWLDGIGTMGPIAGRRVSPNGSKTGRG